MFALSFEQHCALQSGVQSNAPVSCGSFPANGLSTRGLVFENEPSTDGQAGSFWLNEPQDEGAFAAL